MPLNTIKSLTYFLLQILSNSSGVMPLFTEFKLQMFVMRNFNFNEVPTDHMSGWNTCALCAANTTCAMIDKCLKFHIKIIKLSFQSSENVRITVGNMDEYIRAPHNRKELLDEYIRHAQGREWNAKNMIAATIRNHWTNIFVLRSERVNCCQRTIRCSF